MSSEHSKEVSGSVPSIISPDLKIVGDLKCTGDIQIDGTIEGSVKGGLITIGERAKVEGSIVAETVRIIGTVNGRVRAKTVHLDKTGKVIGDIEHEILTIEAGAYFEGQAQPLESVEPGWAAKLARA
jgi:cytoskeletal protein CcmA (bactofilin family)